MSELSPVTGVITLLGVDAPIELTLLALAIADESSPSGPKAGVTIREERGPGDRLEVSAGDRALTISSRSPSFLIESGSEKEARPWFLPVNPPMYGTHVSSSRLRIGIAGGSDTRRLRMSWKTLGELSRRGTPVTAIVIGDCELSPAAEERPHELHTELSPAEYLALLDRLDVILECTDSFGTESFLSVAGRDRGIAVVAHEDRPDLARGVECRAGMWSADGFVDALSAAPAERRPATSPSESLQQILQLIERR